MIADILNKTFPNPAVKVRELTRVALEGGTPLRRYEAAECNADHPGKMGCVLGNCTGCGTMVLINEGFIDRPSDAGAAVLYLCSDCRQISWDYELSTRPGRR